MLIESITSVTLLNGISNIDLNLLLLWIDIDQDEEVNTTDLLIVILLTSYHLLNQKIFFHYNYLSTISSHPFILLTDSTHSYISHSHLLLLTHLPTYFLLLSPLTHLLSSIHTSVSLSHYALLYLYILSNIALLFLIPNLLVINYSYFIVKTKSLYFHMPI